MIRNPIHKRLEKLSGWQHHVFMVCLCERMYPNYAVFCEETGHADPALYKRLLDLVWEHLLVKNAKINFELQLEKLEPIIPEAEQFDIYGVYPMIDACIGLSELLHSMISGESLEHAILVSEISLRTVAMLEMSQLGQELSAEMLKELPVIEQELDIQWEIYRLLNNCEEYDLDLIIGLKKELRESKESNIGIILIK